MSVRERGGGRSSGASSAITSEKLLFGGVVFSKPEDRTDTHSKPLACARARLCKCARVLPLVRKNARHDDWQQFRGRPTEHVCAILTSARLDAIVPRRDAAHASTPRQLFASNAARAHLSRRALSRVRRPVPSSRPHTCARARVYSRGERLRSCARRVT